MEPKKLFGTDGIRGKANQEPISPLTLVKVGRAIVSLLREIHPKKDIKIVIGRDTRISGFMIESALAAGICSQGGRVRLIGEMPTPGIAFSTSGMRADAGIVISASHNPYQDNGVKIFNHQGIKVSEEWERRIEELVQQDGEIQAPTGTDIKRARSIADATGRYTEYLKGTFPRNQTLKGMKIVLDCANGAAYRVAPMVFEELDAELIVMHDQPDGSNINENCGATSPEALRERVIEEKADIGIALDGDADRLICVDDKGNIQDGDTIMAICALALKEKGHLKKDTLVTTQMSNYGLELAMRKHGIKVVRTDVGDRFISMEMRKHGYSIGGEQSGHIIFAEYSHTGDGILSALQLLGILDEKQKKLSEMAEIMTKTPQILLNIHVKEKRPLSEFDQTSALIETVSKKLEQRGRVFVRYSGTENLLRIMVEGDNKREIETFARQIADTLKKELGE